MEIPKDGYLGQYIEPPRAEGEKRPTDIIPDQPIIEGLPTVDYREEKEIEFEASGTSLSLSFSELPENFVAKRVNSLQRTIEMTTGDEQTLAKKILNFYLTTAYSIDEFTIKKGEDALDLSEIKKEFPFARIIVNPKKTTDVNVRELSGTILISGDITRLETILGLLHEMGHLSDKTEMNWFAMRRYTQGERISVREAKQILRYERNAWAFAIRKIKPFLDKDTKEQVIHFMHEDALKSHSEQIREQIAPGWRLFVTHVIEYFSDIED